MTKGRQTEAAAIEAFEAAGFETYRPPKAKYREQDVFGEFDLLAFGHGWLTAAQVKTNRPRGVNAWFERARVYEEHVRDLRVLFLVLFTDEGWKVYETAEEGYQVAFDGRDEPETPAAGLEAALRP